MAKYYVYVANQTATIHGGECSHCNIGRGQKGSPAKPRTTEWLGSFPTKAAAMAKAKLTGRKPWICGHCKP